MAHLPRPLSCAGLDPSQSPATAEGWSAVVNLTALSLLGGLGTGGNRSVPTRPDLRRCRPATLRLLLWSRGSWLPASRIARRYSNQDGTVAVCNHSELFRGSPALDGAARHRSGKISCRVHMRDRSAVVALEVQVVAPAADESHRLPMLLSLWVVVVAVRDPVAAIATFSVGGGSLKIPDRACGFGRISLSGQWFHSAC